MSAASVGDSVSSGLSSVSVACAFLVFLDPDLLAVLLRLCFLVPLDATSVVETSLRFFDAGLLVVVLKVDCLRYASTLFR